MVPFRSWTTFTDPNPGSARREDYRFPVRRPGTRGSCAGADAHAPDIRSRYAATALAAQTIGPEDPNPDPADAQAFAGQSGRLLFNMEAPAGQVLATPGAASVARKEIARPSGHGRPIPIPRRSPCGTRYQEAGPAAGASRAGAAASSARSARRVGRRRHGRARPGRDRRMSGATRSWSGASVRRPRKRPTTSRARVASRWSMPPAS